MDVQQRQQTTQRLHNEVQAWRTASAARRRASANGGNKSGAAAAQLEGLGRVSVDQDDLFNRLDLFHAGLDKVEATLPAAAKRDPRNNLYRQQLRAKHTPARAAEAATATARHVRAVAAAAGAGAGAGAGAPDAGDRALAADAGRLADPNLQAYVLAANVLAQEDAARAQRAARQQHEVLRGRTLERAGAGRRRWLPKGGLVRTIVSGASAAALAAAGTLMLQAEGEASLLAGLTGTGFTVTAALRDALSASVLPLSMEIVSAGFILLDAPGQPLNTTLKALSQSGVRTASILLPVLVLGPGGGPIMAILLRATVGTAVGITGKVLELVVDAVAPYELTGAELAAKAAEQALLRDAEKLKQWEALLAEVRLERRLRSATRLQRAYALALHTGAHGLKRAGALVRNAPELCVSLALGLAVPLLVSRLAGAALGEAAGSYSRNMIAKTLGDMITNAAVGRLTPLLMQALGHALMWVTFTSAHAVGLDSALAGAGATLDAQLARLAGRHVPLAAVGAFAAQAFYAQLQGAAAGAVKQSVMKLHRSGDLAHMRRAVWNVACSLDPAEVSRLIDPNFLFPALMVQESGALTGDLLYRSADARGAAYRVVRGSSEADSRLYAEPLIDGVPTMPLAELPDVAELHVDVTLRGATVVVAPPAPGTHVADADTGQHYRVAADGIGLIDLATGKTLDVGTTSLRNTPGRLLAVGATGRDFVKSLRVPLALGGDDAARRLAQDARRLLPEADENDLAYVAEACRRDPALRAQVAPLVRDLREARAKLDAVAAEQRAHMDEVRRDSDKVRKWLAMQAVPEVRENTGAMDLDLYLQNRSLNVERVVLELKERAGLDAAGAARALEAAQRDDEAQEALRAALKKNENALDVLKVPGLKDGPLQAARAAREEILKVLNEAYDADAKTQLKKMEERLAEVAEEAREVQMQGARALEAIAQEVRRAKGAADAQAAAGAAGTQRATAAAATADASTGPALTLKTAQAHVAEAGEAAARGSARGTVAATRAPQAQQQQQQAGASARAEQKAQTQAQQQQAAAQAEARAAKRLAAQQAHLSQAQQATLAEAYTQRKALAATAALRGDMAAVQRLRRITDMMQQMGGGQAQVSAADVAGLASTLKDYHPQTGALAYEALKETPVRCDKYRGGNIHVTANGDGLVTGDGVPVPAADVKACFSQGLAGRLVDAVLNAPSLFLGLALPFGSAGLLQGIVRNQLGKAAGQVMAQQLAKALDNLSAKCDVNGPEAGPPTRCQLVLLLSSVACGSEVYRSVVKNCAGQAGMLFSTADLLQDLGGAVLTFPNLITQVRALGAVLAGNQLSLAAVRGAVSAVATLLTSEAARGPTMTLMFGGKNMGGGVRSQADAWYVSATEAGGPGVNESVADVVSAIANEMVRELGDDVVKRAQSVLDYVGGAWSRPATVFEDLGDAGAAGVRTAKNVAHAAQGVAQAAAGVAVDGARATLNAVQNPQAAIAAIAAGMQSTAEIAGDVTVTVAGIVKNVAVIGMNAAPAVLTGVKAVAPVVRNVALQTTQGAFNLATDAFKQATSLAWNSLGW